MKGCCLWLLLCLIILVCFVQVKTQHTGANTCKENEVQCDNFQCIARESWCDGEEFDCFDQSDEEYCEKVTWYQRGNNVNKCTEKHFQCANGPCVPVTTRCDGFENCRDGSDEKDCPKKVGELDSTTESYFFYNTEYYTKNFATQETIWLPKFENGLAYSRSSFTDSVQRAQKWILDQKYQCFEWGEDTPRALIALSLTSDNFFLDHPEISLMKNSLVSLLSMKFLQMWYKPPILNKGLLALYINALVATCQDPKQFLEHDLIALLRDGNNTDEPNNTEYPLVFLTMCLTNTSFDKLQMMELKNFLLGLTYKTPRAIDLQILTTMALVCFRERGWGEWNMEYYMVVARSFEILDEIMLEDGSFGNIYTTALAAQAYMHRPESSPHFQKIVNFLIQQQKEDGSFGSMRATYYVLPVLKGRSLLHLRNTRCEPISKPDSLPQNGTISFTLLISGNRHVKPTVKFINYNGNNTFFDIMRVAESMDSTYRFEYGETTFGKMVYSIGGIRNDAEIGMSWSLYSQNLEMVMFKNVLPVTLKGVGVDRIFPKNGFAYTFLYS